MLGLVDEMTASEAKVAARAFIAPINALATGVEFRRHVFGALVAKWRATAARTLRPETLRGYEWALGRILPAFESVPVSQIEKPDIEVFLINCRESGLSYGATELLKTRLKMFFGLGVEWGWISINPVRGRLRFGTPEKARPKTALTRPQVEILVAALPEPYSVMVAVVAFCGLRAGEVAGLQWQDIGEGSIQIRRSVARGIVGPTKTLGSAQSVPLGPEVTKALAWWKTRARFTRPDHFVFALATRSPISMDGAANRWLRPIAHKLGLGLISWHDLRHSCGTIARRELPPEVVQRHLRHANIRTTLGIYSHLTDENAARTIEGSFKWPLPDVLPEGSETQTFQ